MKALLKYGGLAFSGALTLSLFTRLFGFTAFGLIMAVSALALFEIGAIGWSKLLENGRDGQRNIAKIALVITVALSLLSSMSEIVMATQLGADSLALLDMPFITLLLIGIGLATNVIGALAYEYATPEILAKSRYLEREAKSKNAQFSLEDKVVTQSLLLAEKEIDNISGQVASRLALGLRDSAVNHLLANQVDTPKQLPMPVNTDNADMPIMSLPVVATPSPNGHKSPKAKVTTSPK